ncbi:hypothetical protein BUALT_Bualt16G0076900 [Buddleja alternifolia]|uniref:Retrotransposon gag domain-containing protein n=1 Tax=Buddleja alternifolia TaxID=168488 RepID=A0AAV6WKJ6_9LAMI|nr:hypothetical protein BUALT_Bualt16G0076900 [Buddleja alternifolia]
MRQRLRVNMHNPPKGIPFEQQMRADELPNSFQMPNMSEYDDSSDPNEHLRKFKNCALLDQYSGGVKCRVFLTILTRSAQQWFNQLSPNFINSFKEFSSMFLHQFASSKKYQKTSLSLFNMHQKANEPLRGYIQRFNRRPWKYPLPMRRAEKYVNMEEAVMMKGAESLPPNKDGKDAKFVPRRPRAEDRRPEERQYTQLMC